MTTEAGLLALCVADWQRSCLAGLAGWLALAGCCCGEQDVGDVAQQFSIHNDTARAPNHARTDTDLLPPGSTMNFSQPRLVENLQTLARVTVLY